MSIKKLLSKENRKYTIRVIVFAFILFVMIRIGSKGLGTIMPDNCEDYNWCKILWMVSVFAWLAFCLFCSAGAYVFWFGNLDYTKEHLRKAFKAGEHLACWQANGFDGVRPLSGAPGFDDFEEWFLQKNGKVSGLKAKKKSK